MHDAEAKFPWDNIRKMSELGLLGVPWPEELGGAGLDLISYMIVIHELAKVDASHGLTISAHTTLGTSPIVKFGLPVCGSEHGLSATPIERVASFAACASASTRPSASTSSSASRAGSIPRTR